MDGAGSADVTRDRRPKHGSTPIGGAESGSGQCVRRQGAGPKRQSTAGRRLLSARAASAMRWAPGLAVFRSGISLSHSAPTMATTPAATPSHMLLEIDRVKASWKPVMNSCCACAGSDDRNDERIAGAADRGQLPEIEAGRRRRRHEGRRRARRDDPIMEQGQVRLSRKRVKAIVIPMVVPICRNSVRSLVAVPISWKSTEFWTMIVKTANVGPTPRPATNIQAHSTTSSVV